LKFFKAVLQKNDKTINAVLVRNSYLDWIFNIFIENSSRQGMLFSLVLSILDTLKKADSVVLDYVIKKFLPKMKEKSLEMHFEMLIEELKKQKKPQS
jgi:peroxiredoxin family protein